MHRPSIQYIPREAIPDFVANEDDDSSSIAPLPVPPVRPTDEILASCIMGNPAQAQQEEAPPVPTEEREKRIYIKATIAQRQALTREYAQHGITKPVSYYKEKVRLQDRTCRRLLKQLQAGEDITKPKKRGRKPKHTPELLQFVVTDICTKGMTVRESQKDVILANIAAIGRGAPCSPLCPPRRSTGTSRTTSS